MHGLMAKYEDEVNFHLTGNDYGSVIMKSLKLTLLQRFGSVCIGTAKGTFKILEDYGFDALCHDVIIQYTLYVGKYVIIAVSITISCFLSSLIENDKGVLAYYIAGIFLICNKIFSSFTSGIKTTTITVFLYLIEGVKDNNIKVISKEEYNENFKAFFTGILEKFNDMEDDFLGAAYDYIKTLNTQFLYGN
ncbi:hypothetical protein PIROE2DRAFT_1770 [Piromyces sp. E2]|nr:hypothetical protein PIROE2DRAFT_1770 [Piromyces sp. E2]|eukprot:OUM70092.1 hypothetical protein PIROE2DRAFT_1770 [Piromyces sp. E2]